MPAKFEPSDWKWWNGALDARKAGRADIVIGSDDLPIYENKPMTGFYRLRANKDGPFLPAAYWYEDGELNCLINGQVQQPAIAKARWTYAARNPVKHREYQDYMDALEAHQEDPEQPEPAWFDEVKMKIGGETVSSQAKAAPQKAPEPEAESDEPKRAPQRRRGRQKKEEVKVADPAPAAEEDLDDEISFDDDMSGGWGDAPVAADEKPAQEPVKSSREEAKEIAASLRKKSAERQPEPQDDAPAPKSNSGDSDFDQWVDDLNEIVRELDKLRKAGDPKDKAAADKLADVTTRLTDHIKAGNQKRLDQTKPLRDEVSDINAAWNRQIEPADDKAGKALKVVQDWIKAENARLAAEREREEKARRIAEESGDAPEEGGSQPDEKPQSVRVGSRRSVGITRRKKAVITDHKAVAEFFAGQKPPAPQLAEVLRVLAHKAMTAGVEVPGAKLEDDNSVR